VDAGAWAALPAAVAAGHAGALAGWPVPRALDALEKLCHDALARATGGAARYFPNDAVPAHAQPQRLSAWSQTLMRVSRHSEHPWSEVLLIESLVQSAAQALVPAPRATIRQRRGFDTLDA
jgi:DNA polymerase-3 subunit delta'